MAWKIEFKKDALKFLERQTSDTQDRIRHSLNALLDYLEAGIFPFNEMNIRKLSGKLEGHFRLRIGNVRIIFKADTASKMVRVSDVDYRGGAYR